MTVGFVPLFLYKISKTVGFVSYDISKMVSFVLLHEFNDGKFLQQIYEILTMVGFVRLWDLNDGKFRSVRTSEWR